MTWSHDEEARGRLVFQPPGILLPTKLPLFLVPVVLQYSRLCSSLPCSLGWSVTLLPPKVEGSGSPWSPTSTGARPRVSRLWLETGRYHRVPQFPRLTSSSFITPTIGSSSSSTTISTSLDRRCSSSSVVGNHPPTSRRNTFSWNHRKVYIPLF